MEIKISSFFIGLLISSQATAITFFVYSLIKHGLLFASGVYGLTTLVTIYPAILIYLIISKRKNEKRI